MVTLSLNKLTNLNMSIPDKIVIFRMIKNQNVHNYRYLVQKTDLHLHKY